MKLKKLSLAYFGSPYFSADFLERLITDPLINQLIEVKLVVTQPDRPVGRKQVMTPTPVKQTAQKYSLEILEIENLKLNKNLKFKIKNYDLALIYFYGKIIPQHILSFPKHGFWNIHFSLLPKYRGPAPLVACLISGEIKTGVSIIQVDDKLDHGDLIIQKEIKIYPRERKNDLEKRLNEISFEMFKKQINNLLAGKITLTPQNHSQATYTKFPTKADGFIEISNLKFQILNSPEKLFNLFRGLYPWPGLWTAIRPTRSSGACPKRLKITDLDLINNKLVIKKVQLEGKREVDFNTFQKAYQVF
jgi:methionyl-tRNA formyltransferase